MYDVKLRQRVEMDSREGRYGCKRGPIWADSDLESRAISARVTKHIVTIFNKACDK